MINTQNKRIQGLQFRITAVLMLIIGTAFFSGCTEETLGPTPQASQNIVDTSKPNETAAATQTPLQPFVMDESAPDYRAAMRQWVMDISLETRKLDSDFIIIPQNCSPLLTVSGEAGGAPVAPFISAIDGLGRESLNFGEGGFGATRSESSKAEITARLLLAKSVSLSVLSIDYCDKASKIVLSQEYNAAYGFIGFAAPNIELTDIPELLEERSNTKDIYTLSDAENFLIVLNPESYQYKPDFIEALSATDYDVIIIDADFNEWEAYTPADIIRLKTKANGATRLVIAYLSIGEAEDYRDYWQEEWYDNPPEWLVKENRRWDGNYIVKYWREEWRDIVLYGENSMAKRILDLNFDGVYLDIVDGYEYFEDKAGY